MPNIPKHRHWELLDGGDPQPLIQRLEKQVLELIESKKKRSSTWMEYLDSTWSAKLNGPSFATRETDAGSDAVELRRMDGK